jgi:hypothetical protein
MAAIFVTPSSCSIHCDYMAWVNASPLPRRKRRNPKRLPTSRHFQRKNIHEPIARATGVESPKWQLRTDGAIESS